MKVRCRICLKSSGRLHQLFRCFDCDYWFCREHRVGDPHPHKCLAYPVPELYKPVPVLVQEKSNPGQDSRYQHSLNGTGHRGPEPGE